MSTKLIWSYWEGEYTDIVRKCLASWEKFLPGWEIKVLNEVSDEILNIPKPQSFNELTVTTKSDVIRLGLLYKYGGVWMDTTVLLLENLDWLQKYNHLPAFFFKLKNPLTGKKRKYVENWFMYSPYKQNDFFMSWLTILNNILDTKPYQSHIAYSCPCVTDGDYYMAYQAFCHLVEKDSAFSLTLSKSYIVLIDEYPFSSTLYSNWIPMVCHNRLVKFTKMSRELIKWCPFPMPYVYIILVLLFIIGMVSLAITMIK